MKNFRSFQKAPWILQHELAHQLRVDLVGDESMGPTWFYEGFAVVAAGQFEGGQVLDQAKILKIILSEERGNYADFGFVVRDLMRTHSMPKLVELARLERKQFLQAIGYSAEH